MLLVAFVCIIKNDSTLKVQYFVNPAVKLVPKRNNWMILTFVNLAEDTLCVYFLWELVAIVSYLSL